MKNTLLILTVLILAATYAARAETVIAAAAQPQLAADAKGTVWVTFGRGKEVHVARSEDGGLTFAPAVRVASLPSLMLGRRRGPRIVAHDGKVTLTAMAGDLHAFRSTDGGRAWTGPFRVNDRARSAREGLNALAVAPDGRLVAAWLDLRGERTQLHCAESTDGGMTWTDNYPIYRAPGGETVCECCHPSLAFGAGGELFAMWRNALGGARDPWFSRRPMGSAEFAPAAKLGEGTWTLRACPMDGGAVAALADGLVSVWQREGRVFLARPSEPERDLGPGTQPVVAAAMGRVIVVWQRGQGLWMTTGDGMGAANSLTEEGKFPALLAIPSQGGFLAAYERGDAIVIRRVEVE
ncbi:MAG: hypothetical protein RLZZ188_3408 [Verrucomicrobiota bacterium]|jgi:outer membrane protein assembly factor BamB